MGIKGGFSSFIKKKFGHMFVKEQITELGGKKVAIDLAIYLNRFKSRNSEEWVTRYIKFLWSLWYNDITPILVIDGPSPAEKMGEIQARKKRSTNNRQKLSLLKEHLDEYEKDGTVSNELETFASRMGINIPDPEEKDHIKYRSGIALRLRYYITRKCFRVRRDDFLIAETVTKYLGFDCVHAPEEAEAYCCWLNQQGYVDAVMSDDTDVFAIGCNLVICKVDATFSRYVRIDVQKLVEETGFTQEWFRVFCVLCGTDYNSNIPNVGSARSWKLISQLPQDVLNSPPSLSFLNSVLGDSDEDKLMLAKIARAIELFHVNYPDVFIDFEAKGKNSFKAPFHTLAEFTLNTNFITIPNLISVKDLVSKSMLREQK